MYSWDTRCTNTSKATHTVDAHTAEINCLSFRQLCLRCDDDVCTAGTRGVLTLVRRHTVDAHTAEINCLSCRQLCLRCDDDVCTAGTRGVLTLVRQHTRSMLTRLKSTVSRSTHTASSSLPLALPTRSVYNAY